MIECLKYKPINKGGLVGFADLYFKNLDLEVFGCALHQKDGKRWVSLPCKEYIEPLSGEKKFISVMRFRNKTHYDLFVKLAKEAIEKKCGEMNLQQATFEPFEPKEECPF